MVETDLVVLVRDIPSHIGAFNVMDLPSVQ